MEFSEGQELQGEILRNRQQSLHFRQTKKENSENSHSQQDSDYLNPVYQAKQQNKGFASEKNIVVAVCLLVKKLTAPDNELDNTLGFHYFMTLVDEVVEKRIDNPREKLERLLKYTSRNAKEMIKHQL